MADSEDVWGLNGTTSIDIHRAISRLTSAIGLLPLVGTHCRLEMEAGGPSHIHGAQMVFVYYNLQALVVFVRQVVLHRELFRFKF